MSKHQKNTLTFFVLILLIEFITSYVLHEAQQLPEVNGDIFYYFGYGSNMLTKRIHIQNPTAVKLGVGELKDYRLDFNTFTDRWDGAPATIVPTRNATVFGTLWQIDLINLASIDDQEGVAENMYFAESVPINLANGSEITARAYLLVEQPKRELNSFSCNEVPEDHQPSKTYLQCLVKGAEETGLPTHYVNWLRSVKHNGKVVSDLELYLELQDVELNYECGDLNSI